MKKFRIITLILISVPFLIEAQSFYSIRRDRSLMLSVGTGSSSYFGELKDKGKVLGPYPRINLNIGLQYFFTDRIAARAELNWFQLKGEDSKSTNNARNNRNLSFTSNCYELNVEGLINLFPNGTRFYQRATYNVYGFLGIGLLRMNPKAELDGTKYALQPLKTENAKYSLFQPVIPFGIGAKIKVTPFFNIAVEGGWRITFTDYIDDVSTVYPADIESWDHNSVRYKLADRRDPENRGRPKRGNPSKNDSYYLLSLKIEYYLPNNFIFGNDSRKLYNQKRKAIYRKRRR